MQLLKSNFNGHEPVEIVWPFAPKSQGVLKKFICKACLRTARLPKILKKQSAPKKVKKQKNIEMDLLVEEFKKQRGKVIRCARSVNGPHENTAVVLKQEPGRSQVSKVLERKEKRTKEHGRSQVSKVLERKEEKKTLSMSS